MASSKEAVPDTDAWSSLVRRSIEAWDPLTAPMIAFAEDALQAYTSLDDFLSKGPNPLMYWFFQRREAFLAQPTMTKWSSDRLDDYILLPAANGFVKRSDCFFVSHFWHARDDPDPNGTYLRLLQQELRPQAWSYIWLDWTCMPQEPRTPKEENYFLRSLQTMSGIIRNSGFVWFYPPFEPRLWILYEVAEYTLTCDTALEETEDIKEFADHIQEMLRVGVRPTLARHGYRCSYARDRDFLTSWLELLVLLTRLRVDVGYIRQLLDNMTWHPGTEHILKGTINGPLELRRFEGVLVLRGQRHGFTPFPRWVRLFCQFMIFSLSFC